MAYAWYNVFPGEVITWGDGGVINFSGGTVLSNPVGSTYGEDEQVVVIDGDEYDFSVNYPLWESLWNWAAVQATGARMLNNETANGTLLAALEEFEI